VAAPELIDLRRHEELVGRRWHVWIRRGLVGALALLTLLALLNVFGQRPAVDRAENAAATLEVSAPERLRGGLLFMGRFTIAAHQTLRHPALVLDRGWLEGMQINTVTPAPVAEESRDGRLIYRYGTIPAGEQLVVNAEFQVNPTNVGRRSQTVRLEALGTSPLTLERTLTVFP
jgi:hypothetical protein